MSEPIRCLSVSRGTAYCLMEFGKFRGCNIGIQDGWKGIRAISHKAVERQRIQPGITLMESPATFWFDQLPAVPHHPVLNVQLRCAVLLLSKLNPVVTSCALFCFYEWLNRTVVELIMCFDSWCSRVNCKGEFKRGECLMVGNMPVFL